MAKKKYISLSNLTSFLNNLKNIFATKTEMSSKSDKTHSHSISNITNLQSALDGKAPTSHGTHVTYSTTAPVMDGVASVGSASAVARSDHKHPIDTSRAAQTSLDSHTSNTTSHITSTERNNWNTAYNHSQSAHAPSNAEANQNAFSNVKVGDVTIAADIKTDTLTLVAGNNITLTPDATNDKITISAKDTTYTLGTFGITATAAELNKLDGVTATATEINYVDGVTSNIQVQLDGKSASGHTHNYAGSSSAGGAATSANKLNTNAGSATQPVYFANGVPVATTHTLGKSVPSNAIFTDTHYSSKNVVGATNATSNTATALTNGNVYINSVENGAVTSSHKISGSGATTVTTDTSGNIVISSTDNNTTYSAAGSALGLVKSGGDVTISNGVITVNDDSHNHTIANIDNLQTTLDGKQATINGGASTITSSNLTANRALISNGSGKVAVSAVTSTELGYLDGVTSAIQSQLDGKAASSHGNHVPATQTANNAKFLRNDNTWQTVTPANIGAATSGHTHISLSGWSDTRSVDTTPNDYNSKFTVSGLKSNSTIGLSNGGTYSGIVGFRSWSDSSGGNSQEIAFAANGNLYRRHGATTEWGDWLQFIDSGNIGSQSVASATKATQDASGNVITSTYETKANATSKLTEAKTYTDTVASGKANTSHTHSYAGSSSVGGSATSAVKLDTSTAGDANTPVYFSGGKPVACTSLDLNTSGSSASCTGNSATATKLQTARTIALGTGATGTATSFNGTGNITIPVTDVKESYLSWGGKNLVGSVTPIGAALSSEHSANRLAYLNPAAVTVEYSNDAGSTWTDSGLGNSAKINFVTTSNGISVGSNSTVTTNHRTRVTLTAQNGTTGYVYTRPRKMLINVSTAGHGLTVTVEAKTGVSGASWTTLGTYELNGWSGWNDIPMGISTFGGGTNQTGNYWYIRLTFANTSVNSSYTTTKSSIIGLRLFGDTCWTRTSNMGETGHLYSYDSSQNATFPASVTAPTFSGSGVATVSEVKTYLGI